ncbi:MAG: hypothetical protein ACTMIK_12995 [Galactobacter sp.]|uniref:hypothetical protein n=1 Tax=Corynebacterium variabile TaxID=1727 RepID=UPI003FD4FCF0
MSDFDDWLSQQPKSLNGPHLPKLKLLNHRYQQAKRDFAAGRICQADLDYAENQLDQALAKAADNIIARSNPKEN